MLNPPAGTPVPPAFPAKMARLNSENSGKLIQNNIRKTRCSMSYPHTATTAASNDRPMAVESRFSVHRVCNPSAKITVATTL